MINRNVDAAKAVSLINQAIVLSDKKRAVLIELRDALILKHMAPNGNFPRPCGVPRDA